MTKKIQRAITPESGLLEYPMGYFVYAFYSLVNESIVEKSIIMILLIV